MTKKCPIPKILLPVDRSENARRAVEFTGCLGSLMGRSLSGITLLHVMPGSYLGKHSNYKDFRSEVVKQSDTIKKLKAQHIEKDIRPFMDEYEKILKDEGVATKTEGLVVDGDPSHEIVLIADEGRFSTIIMARKGLSEAKEHSLGSVISKVVHTASRQTVYIVGHRPLENRKCPVPRILVPVDGSPYSMKGVEHTACLAKTFKGSLSGITLLRVINVERDTKENDPEKDARKILDEARAVFTRTETAEGLITVKIRTGKPDEEILKEAEEEDYSMIILGRKGRSALKDLLLGGISTTVLQRCQGPVIAIVSSE